MRIFKALPARKVMVEVRYMRADNPLEPVMEQQYNLAEDGTMHPCKVAKVREFKTTGDLNWLSYDPYHRWLVRQHYDSVIPGDRKYVFIVLECTLKDKMQQNKTDAKGE